MSTNIVYASLQDEEETHELVFYSSDENDHTSIQQFIDYMIADGYEVECTINFGPRYEVQCTINGLQYELTLSYVDGPIMLFNTKLFGE